MNEATRSRLLVVDDEPEITEYLRLTLIDLGYDVLTANTGEQALRHFEETPFDLVIVDLIMPGISGFDLMADLHNRDSSLPLIVLSGYDSRDMMREAMKHGAYDFLSKPINVEELQVTLRNALDSVANTVEKKRVQADLERLRSFIGTVETRRSIPDPMLPKLFRGWRREDFVALRNHGKETVLPRGEELSWDSPASGGLIVVMHGRLSVERGGFNVLHLYAGDSWGGSALLNFNLRPVRLIAETDTRIFRLPIHEALAFFRTREERLFKLTVINIVYQTGEWLDNSFDRLVKHEILAGKSTIH